MPLIPQLHLVESCTSTNDLALELAHAGAAHGTIVLSKQQTKGRGRLGRRWASDLGSLYMSLIVRPNLPVSQGARITIAAAVALRTALSQQGAHAHIKWPNDILMENGQHLGKVAGILTEAQSQNNIIACAIVGMGVNIKRMGGAPDEGLPSDAAFLSDAGIDMDAPDLCTEIAKNMLSASEQLHSDPMFSPILAQWRAHNITLGRRVRIAESDTILEGEAIGLTDDGTLLMRLDTGHMARVTSGTCQLIEKNAGV